MCSRNAAMLLLHALHPRPKSQLLRQAEAETLHLHWLRPCWSATSGWATAMTKTRMRTSGI
ncbi:uncharacterized protein TRAVEDRAFT_30438, partial [Trametes versicolor FP-101664 SS1]|uniref:uncharacterized protein n=1 Tax=Trametes versicolor (strain FP-101664) TaxID=717944 RepID=UPI0004623377